MIYTLISYLFYPFLQLLASSRKKQEFRRILVIQTAKIGDMICSTPVFRELKKRYPSVNLSVIATPVTQELLKYNPHTDNIISLDTKDLKGIAGKIKFIKHLFMGKYDICISLNPNIPFTISPLWALIPVRIGIVPDFCGITLKIASGLNTYYVHHETGKLLLETYMSLLKAVDINSENISKEVFMSSDADAQTNKSLQEARDNKNPCLIGIAISSGNKLKELGSDTIASLIRELKKVFNAIVVLIGSKEDKASAQNIINMLEDKNSVIDVTGVFDLNSLPALIGKLSLFIGVDTGITYMADALSVPLIDIAGPSDISDQRPLGRNSVIIRKDIACVPCSHAFKAPYKCKGNDRSCITSVSVTEIVEAAKKLVNTVRDT